MPTAADKRRAFRKLHETGCFVMPNPWDIGSTLYLQSLGFKALATTSAGFAWTMGLDDGGITRDMALPRWVTKKSSLRCPPKMALRACCK